MGCNCKKKPKKELVVISSPEPTPQVIKIPQTPDEQHIKEMNEWNGGIDKTKQEN